MSSGPIRLTVGFDSFQPVVRRGRGVESTNAPAVVTRAPETFQVRPSQSSQTTKKPGSREATLGRPAADLVVARLTGAPTLPRGETVAPETLLLVPWRQ